MKNAKALFPPAVGDMELEPLAQPLAKNGYGQYWLKLLREKVFG